MPDVVLDFERPVVELEQKIEELKQLSSGSVDFKDEIKKLEQKANKLQDEIFKSLTPWQKTQLSRHSQRPYTLDYIARMFDDFIELHGDRNFMDDPAIVGGLCRLDDEPVMIIGHQKGRNTKENVYRNFGMPRPEGYRKALRLMSLAERFGRPIITLIDTPGAYPGIGAEERGQAEAIAKNLLVMSKLRVPVISVVIGEGGSGGALAIGVGNRLLMMEHSIYSVISPEGAATILWKDASKAPQAAETLRYTPTDAASFNICDDIIKEPRGGAHRSWDQAASQLRKALVSHLAELREMTPDELVAHRYEKLRMIGAYTEPKANGKAV